MEGSDQGLEQLKVKVEGSPVADTSAQTQAHSRSLEFQTEHASTEENMVQLQLQGFQQGRSVFSHRPPEKLIINFIIDKLSYVLPL